MSIESVDKWLCYHCYMNIKKVLSDYNIHQQVLPYSCGPCTIMNILRMKGDFSRSEDEMVKICEAIPGRGTPQPNMLKACKEVGVEVVESKGNASMQDIERNIDKGLYVILNYFNAFSGNGHYSFVTDYDDDAIYIADCSLGLLRLRKERLEKNWYGTADDDVKQWYAAVK